MIKRFAIYTLAIASTFAIPVEPAQARTQEEKIQTIWLVDKLCVVAKSLNEKGESVRPGTYGADVFWEFMLQKTGPMPGGSYTNVWKTMKKLPTPDCRGLW